MIGSTDTGRLFEWSPPHAGLEETPMRELEGAGEPLPWLGIDPSGNRLAATAVDGSVWLWNLESGRSQRLGQARG